MNFDRFPIDPATRGLLNAAAENVAKLSAMVAEESDPDDPVPDALTAAGEVLVQCSAAICMALTEVADAIREAR